MTFEKYLGLTAIIATCLSCSAQEPSDTTPTPDMTSFAKGADISWATKMESEGELFFNSNGEPREVTALMKEIGMNAVRYRVWVDPAEGWNSKADVLSKALVAKSLDMRVMIDFHYSDSWADPGQQSPPAAWANYNLTQMQEAVAEHTRDILETLKKHEVDVEWVQVGNETPTGMLLPLGEINSANSNFAELVNSGYDAVKSVYPNAAVIVHVDKGNNLGRQEYVFDYLRSKGGKYDMIGVSLYPEPNNWRTYSQSLISNIKTLGAKYGKPTMICEIGMYYNEAKTAKEMLQYLITEAQQGTNGYCKGIFYWEPQAPAGYNNGYNKGAFEDSKPTIALDPFKITRQTDAYHK